MEAARRRTQAVTAFTSDLQSTLTSILLLPVEVTLRDGGTVADVTVTGACSVDITSALQTASEVLAVGFVTRLLALVAVVFPYGSGRSCWP